MKGRIAALCIALIALACPGAWGARELRAQAEKPGNPEPKSVPGEMLVQFAAGASSSKKTQALARAGAEVAQHVANELLLVRIPEGKAFADAKRAVEESEDVVFAEPNYIYTTQVTNDPGYSQLWGMYGNISVGGKTNSFGSQAAEAWANGNTSCSGVLIGVIDEGLQTSHVDLAANVWTNPNDPIDGVDNDGNGYVDDTNGWDFANNDDTVYDGGKRGSSDNHGTHCSGTIAGVGNNGAGVAGVCWSGVKLISGKFLGRNGGTTANAIRAVDYMTGLKTRHGLNIAATSNSWGGGGYSQGLYDAISRANDANILFIAAAGNSNYNCDTTACFPANYQLANVISVAAIDSAGLRASFSNYGATTVHLGAPGVDIYSSVASNKYATYSGTSMACPHVSGAAAIYAATYTNATAAEIKAAILNSAIPTTSMANTITKGRLDVERMLRCSPDLAVANACPEAT